MSAQSKISCDIIGKDIILTIYHNCVVDPIVQQYVDHFVFDGALRETASWEIKRRRSEKKKLFLSSFVVQRTAVFVYDEGPAL